MAKIVEIDTHLADHLAEAIRDLPRGKILQVIDFADYLRSKYAPDAPQRGSVEVILQALEQVGPLQFAPGELDTLLAEIQTMREMDLESYDKLSA
jgi:hypothetical protein